MEKRGPRLTRFYDYIYAITDYALRFVQTREETNFYYTEIRCELSTSGQQHRGMLQARRFKGHSTAAGTLSLQQLEKELYASIAICERASNQHTACTARDTAVVGGKTRHTRQTSHFTGRHAIHPCNLLVTQTRLPPGWPDA